MPFQPIDPPSRTSVGLAPIGYVVRPPSKGGKDKLNPAKPTNGRNSNLCFRIRPDIAKKADIHPGTYVSLRQGTGGDKGLLQMVAVMPTANGHGRGSNAKVRQVIAGKCKNSVLRYQCPYVGELQKILPKVIEMTGLDIADVSRDQGILIKLPTATDA